MSNNYDSYGQFIGAFDRLYALLLKRYFVLKQWNNSLVDILLLAIANIFGIKIVIVTPFNHAMPYLVITPWKSSDISPYVIIHLANSPYSVCGMSFNHQSTTERMLHQLQLRVLFHASLACALSVAPATVTPLHISTMCTTSSMVLCMHQLTTASYAHLSASSSHMPVTYTIPSLASCGHPFVTASSARTVCTTSSPSSCTHLSATPLHTPIVSAS